MKTGESINTFSDNLGRKFHLIDDYTTSNSSISRSKWRNTISTIYCKKYFRKRNGQYHSKDEKEKIRQVISKKTSRIMRHALESVVAKGGGKSAYIEGYRIGGKTGTAQKVENGVYLVGNYIMSFMAIVPSNNPEAVLYLAIDNPKNTALLSSYTTTPIARRIC